MRRITLDDEALQWIQTGLKSLAKAGHTGERRRVYLLHLAARLGERRRGNPNLILLGRLTPPGVPTELPPG